MRINKMFTILRLNFPTNGMYLENVDVIVQNRNGENK